MDPAVRLRSVLTYLQSRGLTPPAQTPAELKDNDRCYSKGMDQGIHNWLLRSGAYSLAVWLILLSSCFIVPPQESSLERSALPRQCFTRARDP